MPIKWSALEVAEAMDEVEKLLDQAEPYLVEAQEKARKATGIAYLPQYLNQHLRRLIYTVQAREGIRRAITGIRDSIPKGAVEAERQAGRRLQLGLEVNPCRIREGDDFVEALNRDLSLGYGHRRPEREDAEPVEMAEL